MGSEENILVFGLDDDRVRAYYAYMIDVALIFGADWEYATNELKAALEFEIKLAEVQNSEFKYCWFLVLMFCFRCLQKKKYQMYIKQLL